MRSNALRANRERERERERGSEREGEEEERPCLILLYKRDLKTRHRLTAIAGRSSSCRAPN